MRLLFKILSTLAVFSILLSACNLPNAAAPTQPDPNAIFTQAAQTVAAQLTGAITPTANANDPNAVFTQAAATVAAQLTAQGPAATPMPPQATALPPVSTPIPTAMLLTATLPPILPSATPTAACDQATFVADVTIPDDSLMAKEQTFTKTWRFKNTGTCTWTTGYSLVFGNGDQMSGAASSPLAASVAPGQEADLSILLKAPSTPGTYRGYWRIRNASSEFLPIIKGFEGKSFFVQIKVGETGGSTGGKFAVTSVSFAVVRDGTCGSGKYVITATITVNGPGQVTYKWIRSDGATDTLDHDPIEFSAAGSKTVTTQWHTSATGLWMDLYIDKPNHQQFGRANLNCP